MSDFDQYKDTYRNEVENAIGFVGTGVDFFTRAKVAQLIELTTRRLGHPSHFKVLDVGCGVGLTERHLVDTFGSVWGVDVSEQSVQLATRAHPRAHFRTCQHEQLPFQDSEFDVAFAMCVMHHVLPEQWPGFLSEMQRVTRPGGLSVIFEHNPYNPLTRLAVSRCPFDADAVLLSMRQLRRLFTQTGFQQLEGRYILFFPWHARILQWLEGRLGWLCLGGQYCVAGHNDKPRSRCRAA